MNYLTRSTAHRLETVLNGRKGPCPGYAGSAAAAELVVCCSNAFAGGGSRETWRLGKMGELPRKRPTGGRPWARRGTCYLRIHAGGTKSSATFAGTSWVSVKGR